MKHLAVVLLIVSLSGCLAEVLTTTAIQGELAAENATAATRVLDHAKKNVAQVSANQAAAMQQAQGSPITAADIANKEKIRQAVNRYGQAVGYYPPSLQALVQYGYMTAIPKTSAGQDFVFYPENGGLFHPAEVTVPTQPSPTPSRGGAPAGGAGVMGETMTGLAVQQQLNGMNQSGVSNVGSAARQGVRGKSGNYSDKQLQTMKDLDLDR